MNWKNLIILVLTLASVQNAMAENIDQIFEDKEGVFIHPENGAKVLFELPKRKINIVRNRTNSDKAETISIELSAERKNPIDKDIQDYMNANGYAHVNRPLHGGAKSCTLNTDLKFLRVNRYIDSANRTLDNRSMPLCAFYVSIANNTDKEKTLEVLMAAADAGTLITSDIIGTMFSIYKQSLNRIGLFEIYDQAKQYVSVQNAALSSAEAFFALGYAMAKSTDFSNNYWLWTPNQRENFRQSMMKQFFKMNDAGTLDFLEIDGSKAIYESTSRDYVGEKKYEF